MGQFQEQLREGIVRWLESGKKSGHIASDSATVVMSSILGRRSENQDRTIFLRVKFDEPDRSSIAALVLCDGMGGMINGGDCASVAVSAFATSLIKSTASILFDSLREAAISANQAVYERFRGRGGATLSAVACNDRGKWSGVNVGDSRIYGVLEDGSIRQFTIDDTLESQLADLKLSSPPAEFRQLLQYIGMGDGIEPRKVDFQSVPKTKWFLVTSDGAHSVPQHIFRSLISNAESPEEIVHRLTKLSEWLGGKDNSTVSVLTVGEELFLRDGSSAPSSLEIWGIPGKVEFLSLKPIRLDSSQDKATHNRETASTSVQAVKKETEPSQRKAADKPSTKKKRKSSSNKVSVENLNGKSKEADSGKEKSTSNRPQLDIKFSAEEG